MKAFICLLALASVLLLATGSNPPIQRPPVHQFGPADEFFLENHEHDLYATAALAEQICIQDKVVHGQSRLAAFTFCADSLTDTEGNSAEDGGWRLYAPDAMERINLICRGREKLYTACAVYDPPSWER